MGSDSEARAKVARDRDFIGAIAARLLMSAFIFWLLIIPGVRLIGGALLFWIAWKMWKDLRDDGALNDSDDAKAPKGFMAAVWAVVVADVSMSLDNVLGVAGAASGHFLALVFGLILSMALMGYAANWIAKAINKRPWIAYIGLALIVYIAGKLCYEGLMIIRG